MMPRFLLFRIHMMGIYSWKFNSRFPFLLLNCFAFTLPVYAEIPTDYSVTTQTKANSTTADSTISLKIPSLSSGFDINASILWLQPGGGNLLYSVLTTPFPLQSPSWQNEYIEPGFTPSFNIGAGYTFGDTGRDIQLNWTSMNSNDSAATFADVSIGQFVPPTYQVGPDGGFIEDSSSNVNFQYNTVNLDAGQYIQFGQHLLIRAFGGLNYTQIEENVSSYYTDHSEGFNVNQNIYSDYQGIGPRIGMRTNYDVGYGLGIVGQFAASILVGQQKTSTTYISNSPDLANENNYQTISTDNSTLIIPAFDGKLGLSYTHPVDEGSLTVEAGYQGAIYMDAISQAYPGSVNVPIQTGVVDAYTMTTNQSDFSVNGPYVGIDWKIDSGKQPATISSITEAPISFAIPQLQSGFEFNASMLWLQPSGSNLLYGVLENALPLETPTFENNYINPSYSPSFTIGAGYTFGDTGRDIQLSWTSLDSNDSDTTEADRLAGQFVTPTYSVDPQGADIHEATSNVNFKYNTVTLDMGQYFQFSDDLLIRLSGGLNYSQIQQTWDTMYSDDHQTFDVNQNVYSNYQGIGPRIGIHSDYDIGSGFGVVGQFGAAVLIGEQKSNTNYVSTTQDIDKGTTTYQTIDNGNTTEIIPAFDGKLGLRYAYLMDNNLFTIEAGYQAAIYMNAIRESYPTFVDEPISEGTIDPRAVETTESDFTVNGPYIGVDWKMDAGKKPSTQQAIASTPLSFVVPSLPSAVEISGSLLWLQPGGGDLVYAALSSQNGANWDNETIEPGYTPSFNIGARYIFNNTGNDIQLDWTSMNSNSNDNTQVNNALNEVLFPHYSTDSDSSNVQSANSSVNFNYDSVNLDVGQYISLEDMLSNSLLIRFFGGLNYSNIKEDWSTIYTDNQTFSVNQDIDSQYQGLGPRVGFHTDYDLNYGFGITGQFAASLLVGEAKTNTSYTSVSPILSETNYQTISTNNETQLVPAFDGKLGLRYAHQINDNTWTLEAGYQASIYLNALNEAYPSSIVTPDIQTGTIPVNTMTTKQTNFTTNGPYITASLKMDI